MEIPASGDQTMELTGDKLKELTNAIEDEEDDDEVKYQWLMNLFLTDCWRLNFILTTGYFYQSQATQQ